MNADLNTTDELAFFGPQGRRLFGCTHTPSGRAPIAGVVICPPTLVDFDKNYRREFVLAGTLAHRGFAVQRFHYGGSGNSEGSPDPVTLESLVEDALTAAEHLRAATGVDRLGFVGTRVGAFTAAGASRRHGRAPLVLWEPVTDPARYFREAMRSRLTRKLKTEAMRSHRGSEPGSRPGTGGSMSTLEQALTETGWVDILGYPLGRSFYASMRNRTLAGEIGAPRPVQILHVSLDKKLRGDHAALAERLEAIGCAVDARVIADREEAWWFADGRGQEHESGPGAQGLIAATTEWLLEHLSETDAAPANQEVSSR